MTDEQKPDSPESQPPTPEPARDAAIPLKPEPVPAAPKTAPASTGPRRAESESGGLAAGIGKVIQVVLSPLIWVLRPLVFRISNEAGNPKVSFTSFSTLIYLWPIMVVGWLGAWISGWESMQPHLDVLGWIWITVVFLVLICVGADLNRNNMIALAAVILILWLGGALLNAKTDFPVLPKIWAYFADRNVEFDAGTARVFADATAVILLIIIFGAWFDGRYEITTREITHRRILRTSDSLPRAAKRIKRDWRDLAEFLLGMGAGDLIVIDSQKNEVLRIANVPFLWFFRHDVDHILEVLATTGVDDIAAAEEDEFG